MQSQPPPGYSPSGHPPPHQPWSRQPPPGYPPPQPPKNGTPTWVIVLVVLGLGLFFFFGPMAVLAIAGVRKYIANAKTAEARNGVGQLAKDSVAAFEGQGTERRLCPSASKPVPSNAEYIRGRKYQSTLSEWRADANRRAGFACLRFEMVTPQYYQYDYHAGPGVSGGAEEGFVAEAHGDLDGDGEVSTFSLIGRVDQATGTLRVVPTLLETSPEE